MIHTLRLGLQVNAGGSKSLTNRPSLAAINAPRLSKQSNRLSGIVLLVESSCSVLNTNAVDNPSAGLNTCTTVFCHSGNADNGCTISDG